MEKVMVPAGKQVYVADSSAVVARGLTYDADQLDSALIAAAKLLKDTEGVADATQALSDLATTEFETIRLEEILSPPLPTEDWRVGEAISEAYLLSRCGCSFPWPAGRDLKNPKGSPPGADLVGFHQDGGSPRFAFGEVKTSDSPKVPPHAVTGRSGLRWQLEDLKGKSPTKDHLVRYLTHHSLRKPWEPTFRAALQRFLRNRSDVSLFGFLVRDVQPASGDLQSRAKLLASALDPQMSLELRALYLPAGAVSKLARDMAEKGSAA